MMSAVSLPYPTALEVDKDVHYMQTTHVEICKYRDPTKTSVGTTGSMALLKDRKGRKGAEETIDMFVDNNLMNLLFLNAQQQ
jgi:hypothetical protein